MKIALVTLLILSIFALARADSDVVTLTEDNFFDKVSQGVWLVEFYAPWCGHCKRLAPIWEDLASKVKGEFNVAKVDCTAEKELPNKFGIRGFPTIKLIKDGKVYDYNGARDVESFTSFVNEGYTSTEGTALPSAEPKQQEEPQQAASTESNEVVVLTDATFDAQVDTGVWMVEFYAPWCGHCKRLAPVWDALSTSTDGKFKVGKVDCTTNKDTCTRFGVRGYPTIKLVTDKKVYSYNGARSQEAFVAFATAGYESAESVDFPASQGKKETENQAASSGEGKVIVLTESTFDSETASGDWLIEFYAPWCGHCKRLAPIWDELSLKSGDIKVAKVDCTVEKNIATRFGIRGFPTIKYFKEGQMYDYNGGRSVDAFLEFAKNGYSTQTSQNIPKLDIHDEL